MIPGAEEPSFNNPIIIKKGSTLEDLAKKIGNNFADLKKGAKIWGNGSKFAGQEVSLNLEVKDGMQIRFV